MFRKYPYVYAIYREGSFTRAAEKLFISQPSLSAAIQKIEKTIGAPLFERTGTGVIPTEIGREYIAAAEEMMRAEERFSQKLNDIYNLQTGRLLVGGTNYLTSYVLPKILSQFTSRYPKVEVTLVEANSLRLAELVKNEEIDIVIDSFDDDLEGYEGEALLREHILFCVPANRPVNAQLLPYQISPESVFHRTVDLNRIPPVPVSVFQNESFVLLKSGNDMHQRAMTMFSQSGIHPRIPFKMDQMNITYALAASGTGICFVTDTLFRYVSLHDPVVLYNVEQEFATRTLYVAYKKDRYCTKAMSAFIQTAKQVLRER